MNKLQHLEEHFLHNKDTMTKVAKRKLGEFWCEDAVMETYTRCIQYLNRIPDDTNMVNAYLYTTMRNVIRDYMSNRVGTVDVEEDMLESGELVDEWSASGVLESIKADMLKLDSPKKEIVYCALLHGEKYEALSSIYNVSIPAVKMMVYYFRKELEEKYRV